MKQVAIIGAGPAGLQAACVMAFDGISVALIEGNRFGGQIMSSPLIQNICGYPAGFVPVDWVDNTIQQLQVMGVVGYMATVDRLTKLDRYWIVGTEEGVDIEARAVVVATGIAYHRLGIKGENSPHVHYGMLPEQEKQKSGRVVVVVGGRNSAGTACMFLSQLGCTVHQVVRNNSIVSRGIREQYGHVVLHEQTEITGIKSRRGGLDVHTSDGMIEASDVYVFAGGYPATDFLDGLGGLLRTGDFGTTSEPGLFAIGDCKYNSVRTMGAAIGDGTTVARGVYAYLQKLREI